MGGVPIYISWKLHRLPTEWRETLLENAVKKGVRTLLDFRVDTIAVLSLQVCEKSMVFLGSLLLFFELVNASSRYHQPNRSSYQRRFPAISLEGTPYSRPRN
jgi:hypothetical protein